MKGPIKGITVLSIAMVGFGLLGIAANVGGSEFVLLVGLFLAVFGDH